jgi:23S rRNA (cytidine1920-2'-O)/16S rRNA (cytidine1409-2'-O)-methyltransferase
MAERLDEVVVAKTGMTRSQARSLIMEGRVRINGAPATKAGQNVVPGAEVVIAEPRRFVSRGGEKLEHALVTFNIDVNGLRALDVGASTGGFTDCLLQRGAQCVVAVDVGYGQLDWRLRNDPRVITMERTNFRHLSNDAFTEPFPIIVIDTSFISLRTILARAVGYLKENGSIVALVKPQFEAGRERLGPGGVVRDASVHGAVIGEVRDAAAVLGLHAVALVASPLLGPAGNREFLIDLRRDGTAIDDERIAAVVGEGVPT